MKFIASNQPSRFPLDPLQRNAQPVIDPTNLPERVMTIIFRIALPELSVVKCDTEATRLSMLSHARIAKSRNITIYTDGFFIMVAPIIGGIILGGIAILACFMLGIIKNKIAFTITMTCVFIGMALPPIVYIYMQNMQLRKSLRIVLKEHGYPICPHCGKIREGTEIYKELDDICAKCGEDLEGIPKN